MVVCGRDDAELLDIFFPLFTIIFLHLRSLLPLLVCRQGGKWRARVVPPGEVWLPQPLSARAEAGDDAPCRRAQAPRWENTRGLL